MKIVKLDEAHFTGSDTHFYNHYGQHVLFGDEEFDPQDPKFPYMTADEYDNEADELSSHKAYNINSDKLYVGGKLDYKGRFIKIRKQSKFVPGYMDVVIYTDEPNEQVYSFMLSKKDRLNKYKSQMVYSFPEK